jgi:hypothetical protein
MLKHHRLAVVSHGQPYDSRGTPVGYLFGEVVNDSPVVGAEAFSFWDEAPIYRAPTHRLITLYRIY